MLFTTREASTRLNLLSNESILSTGLNQLTRIYYLFALFKIGIRRGIPHLERALILNRPVFGHPESPLSVTGSRSAVGKRFEMK